MKKYLIVLFLISFLFLASRLFDITTVPPSLYWDEVSIGYNAYSVLKTGKDEWGKSLPIHFRAFGEFKLPVYIYSTVISEAVFGLNEFAIRFPAVIFSLGSGFIIYFLLLELYKDRLTGLLGFFLFSISPWDFIFSRAGYEASAGLMFFLLAVLLLLKSPGKTLFSVLGVTALILSIYSYNSFRILAPIIFMLWWILRVKNRFNLRTGIIILFLTIIFIISWIPILRLVIFDAGFGRVQSFSLFPSVRQVYDLSGNPHLQIIYDRSKSVDWFQNLITFFQNYLKNFDFNFLFIKGDPNPRNQLPGFGQLYLIDLPILIVGIIYLFINPAKSRVRSFVPLILLILAPLPAALFKESPHALRSILTGASLVMIASLGITWVYKRSKFVFIAAIVIYLISFSNYLFNFFQTYSVKASQDWQYGYKQVFTQYTDDFSHYDKILVSDRYAQPYIFSLFYLKINPKKFIQTVKYNPPDKWGFSTVSEYDNFIFDQINISSMPKGRLLIFATDQDKLANLPVQKTIKNLDGSIAFYVYQYQN